MGVQLTFVPMVYFMSSCTLTEGGAHYGLFTAILFTIGLVMGTFVRMLVYLTPNPIITMGVQGTSVGHIDGQVLATSFPWLLVSSL